MPLKQRSGKVKETNKSVPAEPSDKPGEESKEQKQPNPPTERQQKRGGRCSSLLKKFGYFSLIIIVPTVLNYAALNQEAKALVPEGQQVIMVDGRY